MTSPGPGHPDPHPDLRTGLDAALATPTPPPTPRTPLPLRPLSAAVNLLRTGAEVVLHATGGGPTPRPDNEGHDALREAGLDPAEWTAKAYRTSEWTMANGQPGQSVRWSFERKPDERTGATGPGLDDLLANLHHRPHIVAADRTPGEWGMVVALGDTQFGKCDGDGAAGTLHRALDCIDQARARFDIYDELYGIGHVHVGWLGDHVEGFVSQGGANTWRTNLTLNEQIRLTRRVMLYALQAFADCGAARVTMAAVPGNHGEPQRIAGTGVTRYDDSHDTEALVAVAEAASLDPARFGHCQFYVPTTDELTVTVPVAGTVVGHAHGHQWRGGKHLAWWQGQAFGRSPLAEATLLLAGHLHHFHAEAEGGRLFCQVPALEAESTWWRHKTGAVGDPGIVVALTRDGVTPLLEVVRPLPQRAAV